MPRKKRIINEEDWNGVAAQIKAIRKKKGVSQYELASKLGVTQRVISYYENTRTNLSVEIINKIAKALGVSQKKFFEYDNNKQEEQTTLSPAMQKKINLIKDLPQSDQQYILKTIDMLAMKNGLK